MKRNVQTMLTMVAALAWAGYSHATVTQIGNWALGENGSTNGGGTQASPYDDLVDSIGGHDVTIFQAQDNVPYLVTSGLAAPGSTAAIAKDASQYAVGAGWHSNAAPINLADDWAFELWVRPDSNAGTILAQTDNSANGISIWAQYGSGASLVFAHGGGGGTDSPVGYGQVIYNLGQWYRADVIRYNGTNYFYIDGTLLGSDSSSGLLDSPMLGFGTAGANGTVGAFDAMRAWSFDHTVDSLQDVEDTIFAPIPEPSSFAILLTGAAGLGLWRKRRSR